MKRGAAAIGFLILLAGFSILAGCVTPPKEAPVSQIIDDKSPQYQETPSSQPIVTPSATNVGIYLTPATPFPTKTASTPAYSYPYAPTPNPEDRICLIYSGSFDATGEVKKTAAVFNLKNPPMYVTYALSDVSKVSGTRIIVTKYAGQSESQSYSYANPVAYLEITARNRTTGTIYTQDGFGKGYGQYLNKTFKIYKPDDLLIEIGGYKLSGTIKLYVKPVGNLENDTVPPGTECLYPQNIGPNTITVVTTATPKP